MDYHEEERKAGPEIRVGQSRRQRTEIKASGLRN